MIRSPTTTNRVLVEKAEPRRSLARIDDARVRLFNALNVFLRQRGDAAHPLQQIQRQAFGCQDGTSEAFDFRQNGSCLDGVAVVNEGVKVNAGINEMNNLMHNGQTRNDQFLFRRVSAGGTNVGGYGHSRSDVPTADILTDGS